LGRHALSMSAMAAVQFPAYADVRNRPCCGHSSLHMPMCATYHVVGMRVWACVGTCMLGAHACMHTCSRDCLCAGRVLGVCMCVRECARACVCACACASLCLSMQAGIRWDCVHAQDSRPGSSLHSTDAQGREARRKAASTLPRPCPALTAATHPQPAQAESSAWAAPERAHPNTCACAPAQVHCPACAPLPHLCAALHITDAHPYCSYALTQLSPQTGPNAAALPVLLRQPSSSSSSSSSSSKSSCPPTMAVQQGGQDAAVEDALWCTNPRQACGYMCVCVNVCAALCCGALR